MTFIKVQYRYMSQVIQISLSATPIRNVGVKWGLLLSRFHKFPSPSRDSLDPVSRLRFIAVSKLLKAETGTLL
jgi:hypothetical protein